MNKINIPVLTTVLPKNARRLILLCTLPIAIVVAALFTFSSTGKPSSDDRSGSPLKSTSSSAIDTSSENKVKNVEQKDKSSVDENLPDSDKEPEADRQEDTP